MSGRPKPSKSFFVRYFFRRELLYEPLHLRRKQHVLKQCFYKILQDFHINTLAIITWAGLFKQNRKTAANAAFHISLSAVCKSFLYRVSLWGRAGLWGTVCCTLLVTATITTLDLLYMKPTRQEVWINFPSCMKLWTDLDAGVRKSTSLQSCVCVKDVCQQ